MMSTQQDAIDLKSCQDNLKSYYKPVFLLHESRHEHAILILGLKKHH